MNNPLTIVMYHYVRDLKNSRYPSIRGLDVALFKQQLDYCARHYNFVSMEQIVEALEHGGGLPPRPVLLTFDDGYVDHFTNVFPILRNRGISGAFYPPIQALTENDVLDVNKIHFILSSCNDISKLVHRMFDRIATYRNEFRLASETAYRLKYELDDRFDPREVILFKRVLQVGLPEVVRSRICNELFEEFVGMSVMVFSRELYMSPDQIKCMSEAGMHIGSHGYNHYWLASLSKAQQVREVDASLAGLSAMGVDTSGWTMCYPYGSYNQDLIDVIRERGCKLALTTEVELADLRNNDRFKLPRLDTNDLPKVATAEVSSWTQKVGK